MQLVVDLKEGNEVWGIQSLDNGVKEFAREVQETRFSELWPGAYQ